MDIFNIDDISVVSRVEEALRSGEVVCLPTDTVYGLVCDALNEEAVRRIYEIKGRDYEKPLLWFVSGVKMAREYAEVSEGQERFLEQAWPGKVTVVFSARDGGTIGMRVPGDAFLQKLLEEFCGPLAQTSANPAGKEPAGSVREALEYFNVVKYSIELVVDGGVREGEASSVVDLSGAKPKMLREGAVSQEAILRIL